MKKTATSPHRFSSLAEAHQALGLPQPQHPLISLLDATAHPVQLTPAHGPHVLSFYKIALKTGGAGQLAYGQGHYDFTEGSLLLAAPNQLLGSAEEAGCLGGIVLLVHPDFLLGYPLAKTIKQHGFFSYATHEALHLSDEEQATLLALFGSMAEELNSRLDDLSQEVLLAQLDLLLTYAQRFYQRQFLTRRPANRVLLQRVDELLDAYFEAQKPLVQGLAHRALPSGASKPDPELPERYAALADRAKCPAAHPSPAHRAGEGAPVGHEPFGGRDCLRAGV